MNIIITGPQGSGKGTQAKLLAKELGLFHQENGSMLRKLAKNDPKLDDMMDNGQLVPDMEMIIMMEKNLESKGIGFDNIIFDGYPRTESQYLALKDWLATKGTKIDYAIVLVVGEKETVKRLSARRINKKTGEIYNLITNVPVGVPEEDLVHRDDDKPDSIRRRLNLYNEKTKPLIDLYRKDGILIEIDGERPIDEIAEDILSKITA